MSRPAAPSMPTEKQVRDAYESVSKLFPDVKIARVGPDGVIFDYGTQAVDRVTDRPFTAGGRNG